MANSPFAPIENVETYMAATSKEVEDNIISSLKLELPEIEQLPEWRKSKKNAPIAIAGGGPSIKYTVEELKHFKTIIACGSSHDWLVEHEVSPHYCIILDPDIASSNYIRKPLVTCNYLVASCCHPKVFDLLKNYSVTRWHSAGLEPEWFNKQWAEHGMDGNKKPLVGGGCTCGLRAITIAMLFGYRNLHFFGMDSNLDLNTNQHHAYDFVDPETEHLGDVIEMRISETGRIFNVAKYMMAQLWGFKELITGYSHLFDVTVHGDSIIYEFMKFRRLEQEKINAARP